MSEALASNSVKTVLHVGCGFSSRDALPGIFQGDCWRELRLDINPAVQPDIVASLTDMVPVSSASVDAVYSAHNLEHLYSHEVAVALAEFYRVLRAGGIVYLRVPDLQKVCEMVANDQLEDIAYHSPAGPIAPLDMLYGLRPALADGNLFMAHKTGFTATTLDRQLKKSGFLYGRVMREGFALSAMAYKE